MIRNVIVAIFYALLIYITVKNLMILQDETTTFEEKATSHGLSFPSITILHRLNEEDNFTTFEDIMNVIEGKKLKYEASLILVRLFGYRRADDLLDPQILEKYHNTTLENVWEYSVNIEGWQPFGMGISVTLNPPKLQIEHNMDVYVSVLPSSFEQSLLLTIFKPFSCKSK